MVVGMACALFAALGYGSASVLQSVAARKAESSSGLDPRLFVRLAGSVPYVSGLGLDLGAFLASLVALRTLPLFFVQSAVAASVGVTAVTRRPSVSGCSVVRSPHWSYSAPVCYCWHPRPSQSRADLWHWRSGGGCSPVWWS